jgi:hypothetical protein
MKKFLKIFLLYKGASLNKNQDNTKKRYEQV